MRGTLWTSQFIRRHHHHDHEHSHRVHHVSRRRSLITRVTRSASNRVAWRHPAPYRSSRFSISTRLPFQLSSSSAQHHYMRHGEQQGDGEHRESYYEYRECLRCTARRHNSQRIYLRSALSSHSVVLTNACTHLVADIGSQAVAACHSHDELVVEHKALHIIAHASSAAMRPSA